MGDVVLVLLVAGIVWLFLSFDPTEVLAALYNPWVGVVVLLLILEYLWIKSGDRTRIYRRELDRLRDRAKKDERLLRRSREILSQTIDGPATEEEGRPGDWLSRARELRQELDERL